MIHILLQTSLNMSCDISENFFMDHYYITSAVDILCNHVIINNFIYRNALINAVEAAARKSAELCPKK